MPFPAAILPFRYWFRHRTLPRLTPGFLFFLVPVGYAVYLLGRHLWYEWQGLNSWDYYYFWALAQGVLNGYTPYVELFDPKPPGIFLLSAVSLLLTGTDALAGLFQVATLIVSGLLLYLILRRTGGSSERVLWPFNVLTALSLVLYAGVRAGMYLPESFALPFALGYVWFLTRPEGVRTLTEGFLAGLLLLGAAGFKEPFFLSGIAAGILLTLPHFSWLRLYRQVAVPAITALVMAVVLMALLGWLIPYLTIYLPAVFWNHFQGMPGAPPVPIWWRGLQGSPLWRDIQELFPGYAWHMAIVGTLAVYSVLSGATDKQSGRLNRTRLAIIVALTLTALYLLVLSVAVSNHYYFHHFVVAVPGYVAGSYLAVRTVRLSLDRRIPRAVVLAFALALLPAHGMFRMTAVPYAEYLNVTRTYREKMNHAAWTIDHVMDTCGIDRYLLIGNGPQPYGLTRHSPSGPMMAQHTQWFIGRATYLREGYLRQLDTADFVVVHSYQLADLESFTVRYLTDHFTSSAEWCSASSLTIPGYTLLYRQQPRSTAGGGVLP
jgi:hypothetical protein